MIQHLETLMNNREGAAYWIPHMRGYDGGRFLDDELTLPA
jgi:hypothetical protein